jgi:hypothetical protein
MIPNPRIPFIWPTHRLSEEPSIYELSPPFGDLVLDATWLFGVVPALTSRGVKVLDEWLKGNLILKISIVVVVYPACAARQSDLADLHALARCYPDRFSGRILPLEQVTDRSINAICFSTKDLDFVQIVVGPSEGLGLDPWGDGHINFAFQANPSLLEAFRSHFDWLWGKACDIFLPGATDIPELALPKGSEEAARTWRSYLNEIQSEQSVEDGASSVAEAVAEPAAEPGEAGAESSHGKSRQSPTEQLGIQALDPLAEFVAGLYGKGSLVSIDKLSKIPPLDAPLDPNLFGDASELRSGSVTRKVNMRVSVIDEKTLKEIESCRQALRTLLTKFTFGLADNMRWMPNTARKLFEAELKRANDEGLKLISDLLKGDVDAFLSGKREKLVADLNGIYSQLGRLEHVTPDVVEKVVANLKVRLTKAQSSNFMPKLSYSSISFTSTEGAFSSPWGQAYSLLSDVAAFPRKAHSDSFFFRGLKTPKKELLVVMDVADDVILRDPGIFELEDRCKLEIGVLSTIENAPIESKMRCRLVRKIIEGASVSSIMEELDKELKKEPT